MCPRSRGMLSFAGRGRWWMMHKLCNTTMAISQHVKGVWRSVPPLVSIHVKRDLSSPKLLSMIHLVFMCASLYLTSCGEVGFKTGVKSQGCNGYSLSPNNQSSLIVLSSNFRRV
jgi:hypothetical protein